MAEVLVRYAAEVLDSDGARWTPQACGGIADDGLWEGWIEFVSGDRAIRTGRETEQPSRDMVMYWAQGLTATYLEGALARAMRQPNDVPHEPNFMPRFESSARKTAPRGFVPGRAILNPFTTLAQGEQLLRGQLDALSRDNLVAIVEDYALPVEIPGDMSPRGLADAIVEAVKRESAGGQAGQATDRSNRQPDDRPTG